MRSMEKIISAELSFSPIDTKDYLADIEKVLVIIKAAHVEYRVGVMSTVVIGAAGKIFQLIETIYKHMDDCCGFTFHITVSNRCAGGMTNRPSGGSQIMV